MGCWRVGAEGLGAYRAFGLGLRRSGFIVEDASPLGH